MEKRDLMREERNMIANLDVVNYFANFADGSSALFYVDQPNIGPLTIKAFCEKVTKKEVLEVYHIPQEDLQYYCIDERVWVCDPKTAEKLRKIANS